jgi:dipeptidyl aminopeptidase/acylaminoacyl peptidase
MSLFKFLFLMLIFCTWSLLASAMTNHENQTVFVSLGNIYYNPIGKTPIQITHSQKDSSPVLSSNKKMIAFIRVGNNMIPKECDGDTETKYGDQIWIYDVSTKKEYLLVANNFECNVPEKQIVDPKDLLFSPDDKILYFMTSAWTTSGALHGVKIENKEQYYIAPANTFSIVTKGQDKGYLIVYQHRYFIGGGTYDWYWLISPNGKEEGPLGPEITQEQMDFIES